MPDEIVVRKWIDEKKRFSHTYNYALDFLTALERNINY